MPTAPAAEDRVSEEEVVDSAEEITDEYTYDEECWDEEYSYDQEYGEVSGEEAAPEPATSDRETVIENVADVEENASEGDSEYAEYGDSEEDSAFDEEDYWQETCEDVSATDEPQEAADENAYSFEDE